MGRGTASNRALAAMFLLLAALGAGGARAQRLAVPAGVRSVPDLEYARPGGTPLFLDLYLPEKAPPPVPVVIWIHGGGWRQGSRKSSPALFLAARGCAVASVGYRLSGQARFPAQIEDCKAAVRWLRGRAREYGLDPGRFGAWGSSAGGHLAALLGTSGEVRDLEPPGGEGASSRVQAVRDWFGPTDFLRMNDFPGRIDHNAPESPESQLLGGPIQQHRDRAARANPAAYASGDDPPFLIMHGDRDPLVPLNQSEILFEALKKAGTEVTLVTVKGAGHGLGGAAAREWVSAFFDRHLRRDADAWSRLAGGLGRAGRTEIPAAP